MKKKRWIKDDEGYMYIQDFIDEDEEVDDDEFGYDEEDDNATAKRHI